jgi:hypothetical protein
VEDLGIGGNKMDIQEIGWEGVDWIDLAQDKDKWHRVTNL